MSAERPPVAVAFVAGFLAVLLFQQPLLLPFYLGGLFPVPPYNMTPTAPLGVPQFLSLSFWGGVWGIVFALVVPGRFRGTAYWAMAAVFGAVAPTVVFAFVVEVVKSANGNSL